MALNFYRQRDIDEMDINDIPEEFINYFDTLDDERKAALIGSRPDLAEALGFELPEKREWDESSSVVSGEQENGDRPDQDEIDIDDYSDADDDLEDESNEDGDNIDDELVQIRLNKYENQDLNTVIRNNMPEIEALCVPDEKKNCLLHRIPFIEKQIKYTSEKGAVYGVVLRVCPECNRIYIKESMMESVHQRLIERNIPHTLYSLELTNLYLRSQMPPYEFGENEVVYVPDTWVEERPVCPIHDEDLYEIPCIKRHKDREISFTGYFCDKCGKVIVRRSGALDLEDECGRLGIAPIQYESLRKKTPEKKPIPPKQIKSDYIIENGRRTEHRENVTGSCYELTETDTVIVSDSIYCDIDGHDTEEVAGLIYVDEKRGEKKGYLFRLGYCVHCQKYHMEENDYKRLYDYGRPEVQLIRDIDDTDLLITSGEVFDLERTHLEDVEDEIDFEALDIKGNQDYVNPYTPGDYDDGNLSFAKYMSERKYRKRLNELASYKPKPYSYRVDITIEGRSETYYVGAADIYLNGEQQVISANSDFGHELINYQTIKGKKDGKEYDIKLTRQFEIEHAFLYGYLNLRTDEDIIFKSGITDPFLVRVLNIRKRQHNLTDIFVTIQENQNAIVNTAFEKNIIVQGCAGSGKTMVLLHRLSSLNYRQKSFDFSRNAMILTPNDQFTLHIKGLADELQIGSIHRASVEQYYIDTLMEYSDEFKLDGKVSSEMIVRQSFVDYIYSDQFRTDFSLAYASIIKKRNTLIEILGNLTEAMGQPDRSIDLSDDTKVVQQLRYGVDSMRSLVNRKESEIESAETEHKRLIERKHFLEEKIPSLRESSGGVVVECLPRVNSKIGAYLSERKNMISELEDQIKTLQEEREKVQKAIIMIGKKARLEELDKNIRTAERKLKNENRRMEEEISTLSESTEGINDDEIISWMRKVMLIIPSVQEEVKLSNNLKDEYRKYTDEYNTIDPLIKEVEKKIETENASQYSDEVKRAIQYLYDEIDKYSLTGTFQLVFDQTVAPYKEEHNIKSISGKYHRYDLYARLLFAMKYFGKAIGNVGFMCIDEGQDLAFNEYLLIYELNQQNVVFNIFGDTNQLMKEGRGISDWSDLEEAFKTETYTLNENYRNTNQITRFCNSSFGMNVMQTGVDGPNVREIPRRELEKELAMLNVSNERIAILVPRGVQKSRYLDKAKLPSEILKIIGDRMDNGYISLMYVDEVKGIEFDKAYVVGNKMSRNEKYIAYTRALSELILVVDDQVEDYDDGSSQDGKKKIKKENKPKKRTSGKGVLNYKSKIESAPAQDIRENYTSEEKKKVEEADKENDELHKSVELKETVEKQSDKPKIPEILAEVNYPYDMVWVIGDRKKQYYLAHYQGKLPGRIAKQATSMYIPVNNDKEESVVFVHVFKDDRVIFIADDLYQSSKKQLTESYGLELNEIMGWKL